MNGSPKNFLFFCALKMRFETWQGESQYGEVDFCLYDESLGSHPKFHILYCMLCIGF